MNVTYYLPGRETLLIRDRQEPPIPRIGEQVEVDGDLYEIVNVRYSYRPLAVYPDV